MLDWYVGLVRWIGMLDWYVGLVCWIGTLDWYVGLVRWIGMLHTIRLFPDDLTQNTNTSIVHIIILLIIEVLFKICRHGSSSLEIVLMLITGHFSSGRWA